MLIVLLVHILSCLFLTGLIWTVQSVHYPSFHFVNNDSFEEFSSFHQTSITKIVAPIMIIEFITAIILIYLKFEPFFLLNLITVLFLWCSTMFISIPIHKSLSHKKDYRLIDRLVQTNWLRTTTWTIRSLMLITFLSSLVQL